MYAVSSVNEGRYRVLSEVMTTAFRNPAKQLQASQVMAWKTSEQSSFEGLNGSLLALVDLRPVPERPIVGAPVACAEPKVNLVSSERSAEANLLLLRDDTLFPPPSSFELAVPPLLLTKFQPVISSPQPEDVIAVPENPLEDVMERLKTAVADFIDAELMELRHGQTWVEVEIRSKVLFASGSANLNERAEKPLEKIASVLSGVDHRIRVEGFTDNVPISTEVYPSNWELSAARAASVVHLLAKQGISPNRMAAIGYGQYQPVADNSTAAGRARNRRVVLVILSDDESPAELSAPKPRDRSAEPERIS